MIYIHYGGKHFDKDEFKEIQNINFVKPLGGFWASRTDTNCGWKDWCELEHFHLDKYTKDNCFKFKLKEDSNILVITRKEQLEELPKQNIPEFNAVFVCIDFEKLSKQYDAIEVLISEDNRLYWDLYGWDCDSILIMNKQIIEEI